MLSPSPAVTPRRAAGQLPGTFIGISIPHSQKSGRVSPTKVFSSPLRSDEVAVSRRPPVGSPPTVGSSGPPSSSSASAGNVPTSSSSQVSHHKRVAETPKSRHRVPQVVVPSVPRKMASTPIKVPAVPTLEDEEDELSSLSDLEPEVVVVAAKKPKKPKAADVLGAKPANVKKAKKANGEDGAPVKPKKRKSTTEGGGEPKAGPSKKKAKKAIVVADGEKVGEEKADGEADADKKPKARSLPGTVLRCHQCRSEFPDHIEKLIRCSKTKVKPMTKVEREAKGLSKEAAPVTSERCVFIYCGKCLSVR